MAEQSVHPNVLRLLAAIRAIRYGKITEIQIADGIPIRFRVEQLVDLSKGEETACGPGSRSGCVDRYERKVEMGT
jgi:hypothetical protein